MTNKVYLIGEVVAVPIYTDEPRKKKLILNLSVPKTFKNENGEYEKDLISVEIYDYLEKKFSEICNKHDIVVIEGRIDVTEEGLKVVATFVRVLGSKKV